MLHLLCFLFVLCFLSPAWRKNRPWYPSKVFSPNRIRRLASKLAPLKALVRPLRKTLLYPGGPLLLMPTPIRLLLVPGVPGWNPRRPKLLGLQFNGVYQYMPPFHSPYQGPHSLTFHNNEEQDTTHTYGVYLGSQLARNLQLYVDTELFQGFGVSDGQGLAGYVNGDVIRAGSSNLPKVPYLARYYLRYFVPLSSETEKVERCMDQLPGEQPVSRFEIKFGRLALTDDFDQNRYANNNRAQFMNYDFMFNTAWDYAADTRGYSVGAVASLFEPRWKLAFGVFMLPNTQNGAQFDYWDTQEFGYNLELTVKPNNAGTVVRLLTYYNQGRMGSYDAALALGHATSTVPDILLVEQTGGTQIRFWIEFRTAAG